MCCTEWKRLQIYTSFVEIKISYFKTLILDLLLFCSILRNFAMHEK